MRDERQQEEHKHHWHTQQPLTREYFICTQQIYMAQYCTAGVMNPPSAFNMKEHMFLFFHYFSLIAQSQRQSWVRCWLHRLPSTQCWLKGHTVLA